MNAFVTLTDEVIQLSITLALLALIASNLVAMVKQLKRILGGG